MSKLYHYYHAMVRKGEISEDLNQIAVITHYERLLQTVNNEVKSNLDAPLFRNFFRTLTKSPLPTPTGLYIYGSVGCGKTMLMDLFFSLVETPYKKRMCLNNFMSDVHIRINNWHHTEKNRKKNNPFLDVAKTLAKDIRILCLDEFSVTNIADGMILARLFTALFAKRVILVATSNVAPDDLYHDGLNRQLFLPFVDLLKRHVKSVCLDTTGDYRLKKTGYVPIYITPLGTESDRIMDVAWEKIKVSEEEKQKRITIQGHHLIIPRASGIAARFDFWSLCSKPLAALDYKVLSEQYQIFFIEHVPFFNETLRNEAKRFILLIDTLYDQKKYLFLSAAASPEKLYKDTKKTIERFEFNRTISRLFEMQSVEYLHKNDAFNLLQFDRLRFRLKS